MTKNLLLGFAFVLILFACSDDKDGGKVPKYDPNKEVSITKFIPDSGGIAEQVILYGNNFGDDPSKIKLFFNEKEAAVISVQGDKLLALAPRLPGDVCELTLQVENQKTVADKTFLYLPRMTVSTVAGSKQANGGKFNPGPLATSAFGDVRGVFADGYGNIFVSMYKSGGSIGVARIDIPNNDVSWVSDITGGGTSWNNGCVDPKTNIVYFMSNVNGIILELDPARLWSPRSRKVKSVTAEEAAEHGTIPWTNNDWWKYNHSVAMGADGFLYTRNYYGRIAKIDPKTWTAYFIGATSTNDGIIDPVKSADTHVAINPLDPDWLYMSYQNKHCIKRFHLKEHRFEDYVGVVMGTGAWKDGVGDDARFHTPKNISFDNEGFMYVADYMNHCIRRVSPTREVTTVAGIPGKSGEEDGDPMTATFYRPWGVCVDQDNNIYVGEEYNNKVRKITLE